MPEKQQNLAETIEDNKEEQRISQAQMQKQQNAAYNANTGRNIADLASKSANPYAKAAGVAAKVADKVSGGKSSVALGKAVNRANKFLPGGNLLQKVSNETSQSGTSNRISQALSKKSSSVPVSPKSNMKNNAVSEGRDDSYFSKKEVEEQTSDGGGVSFKATVKFLKTALIAFVPVMTVVIFINLFTSSSQAFANSFKLGLADTLTNEQVEDQIKPPENDTDKSNENLETFEYDYFIDDEKSKFRDGKLNSVNLVPIATNKSRLYNEADIKELEDFYSQTLDYDENYDMDQVYTFYFKLYYLYMHYNMTYHVELDMPLLMSTLNIQSEDMNVVFKSNIIGYDQTEVEKKYDNDRFKYDSVYKYTSTLTSGEYDMEILAQHMVSKVPYVAEEQTCKIPVENNKWCYVIDEGKYNEFLKEFLEKKYFLEDASFDGESDETNTTQTCSAVDSFVKYNLTDDQVRQIASLAYHEQGTAKGAAAEASLMANLFETRGSSYGTGANGLYNYIKNSGWFANSAQYMSSYDASEEIVAAVKSVLVDGKRTLPAYINEHDWINDISSATTNGKSISVSDKSSYVKFKTKLKNIYGSTYTFYSFPDTNSDPFGYTSEEMRKEKGEFYYDFDTGEPMNCSGASSNSYADAIIELANKELIENNGKGGNKYNSFFNYAVGTPWCANFVSYLFSNTTVDGVAMYPSVIDFTTPSVGTFIRNFSNSEKQNIKFYYNDSCSNLKGKNGETTYTPKKGDLIFFDWGAEYYDISSATQDHVGIVEKYVDGIIYTIEGNSGTPGRVKKKTYSISSCMVIGFGSWY